jgi:hypothetical protein
MLLVMMAKSLVHSAMQVGAVDVADAVMHVAGIAIDTLNDVESA